MDKWIEYCGTLRDFADPDEVAQQSECRDEFVGAEDYAAYCEEWC